MSKYLRQIKYWSHKKYFCVSFGKKTYFFTIFSKNEQQYLQTSGKFFVIIVYALKKLILKLTDIKAQYISNIIKHFSTTIWQITK